MSEKISTLSYVSKLLIYRRKNFFRTDLIAIHLDIDSNFHCSQKLFHNKFT